MQIHYNPSQEDILSAVNQADENIILSIKSTQHLDKIVGVGIQVLDSMHVLTNMLDIHAFLDKVIRIVIKKKIRILVYDLKLVYRILGKQSLLNYHDLEFYFTDIRLNLYHIFNRQVDLYEDLVKQFASIEYDDHLIRFYDSLYGFTNFPHQILNERELQRIIQTELVVLSKILGTMQINSSSFTNMLHYASKHYAMIENTGLAIDTDEVRKHGYKAISKYFEDYEEESNVAYIRYDLDHTSTGRLSSPFHSFQKDKYGSIIKSRYENGILLCCDFSCYELKVLMDTFGIVCPDKDPYQKVAELVSCKRNRAKSHIIKWMYGSTKYDEEIVNAIKYLYDFGDKIEQFRTKCISELRCITSYGKIIKYKTEEDARSKSVNNLIQNCATYISLAIVSILNETLMHRTNLQANIIATVHDEIILDCSEDAISSVIKDFDWITQNSGAVYSSTSMHHVQYEYSIRKGKNLAELTDGN